MVDAFTLMESYCQLLIERIMLIQKNKECPDELKEATSSLMYASSRCGEFPELLHIRGVLSSTFGKEFVARAVELRNNCSVNPKIIQKLSTRQPSLENKLKLLKEIASEMGITLPLEAVVVEENVDVNEKQDESVANESAKSDDPQHKDATNDLPIEIDVIDEKLSESIKARKKYRDVAAAAQEAFESAAHAAAAARAAVELSRNQPQGFDPHDGSGSSHEKGADDDSDANAILDFPMPTHATSSDGLEHSNNVSGFEKILPIDDSSSESEAETMAKTSNDLKLTEIDENKQNLWIGRTISTSSSDSGEDFSAEKKLSLDLLRQNEALGDELAIEIPNTDVEKEKEEAQWRKPHDLSSDNIGQNEEINEDTTMFGYQTSKLTNSQSLNFEEQLHSQHSHMNIKWVSMRTRRELKI